MPHSLRPASALACLLSLISAPSLPVLAQTSTQPPANYHGPTLFGVCVYVLGDTSFYSNLFSTSGYFKFKAQEAFQQYATSRANGAQLKGAGCRWSTSQQEIATQKDADKRLLGLPGRSAKGVETGWTYTPGATVSSATPASGAAQSSPAASVQTAGASAQQSASSNANPSIAQSTQQTLNNSKNSATGAVNDTVATTMGTVTNSATSAIKGMFNHKAKTPSAAAPAQPASADPTPIAAPATPAADTSAQSNPPGSGATGSSPAPLGFINTESPEAATAEAQQIQGLVADVAGHNLIINVGTEAGVHPGAKLLVMHPVRTVKDPATGKVLRTVEDKVGDLTIKNADTTSAAGTFSGTTPARVGDIVRSQPQ